jgi:hypothetical protein
MASDNLEARMQRAESLLISVLELSAENSRQIQDLRILVGDLREGQALLTQFQAEDREALAEFRRATNASLDRIDLTLQLLRRQAGLDEE